MSGCGQGCPDQESKCRCDAGHRSHVTASLLRARAGLSSLVLPRLTPHVVCATGPENLPVCPHSHQPHSTARPRLGPALSALSPEFLEAGTYTPLARGTSPTPPLTRGLLPLFSPSNYCQPELLTLIPLAAAHGKDRFPRCHPGSLPSTGISPLLASPPNEAET